MNAPQKCPKCGADLMGSAGGVAMYECLTDLIHDPHGTLRAIQTATCITRQRDALAERVKRLEEAGNKLAAIVGQKGDPANWVDEPVCDEAWEAWAKAKEAKP